MLKLADRVRQAHAAGYTQTQLAKAAGVSSSAAAQWASGNTKSLSGEAAAGLALLTGWSAVWWATGKGPREGAPGQTSYPATQGPTALLAQEPSYPHPIILPTTIEWESLMGAVLPKRFACVIRDEAMAPAMRPGYLAIFDSSLEPQPGDVVLLADADDMPHVREYRAKRGDHWLAVATNPAYAELDSRADGLRVLAVHVGGIWR